MHTFFKRWFKNTRNIAFIHTLSGPFCKHRHRRRVLCPNYLAGFCPDGRDCKYAHPSFNIPPVDTTQILRARGQYNIGIVCHNCHERGHKVLIKHDSQFWSLIHISFQFDGDFNIGKCFEPHFFIYLCKNAVIVCNKIWVMSY